MCANLAVPFLPRISSRLPSAAHEITALPTGLACVREKKKIHVTEMRNHTAPASCQGVLSLRKVRKNKKYSGVYSLLSSPCCCASTTACVTTEAASDTSNILWTLLATRFPPPEYSKRQHTVIMREGWHPSGIWEAHLREGTGVQKTARTA